jgi:hypothetical protein
MVFARSRSAGLDALVRELDKAARANRAARLGACVVFLADADPATTPVAADARKLADAAGLQEVILAVTRPASWPSTSWRPTPT